MPGALSMTWEEGVADGVDEVRRSVRYQIKHGAKLIKICASGGVMSDSGSAGAQHYSDAELDAIVDEVRRSVRYQIKHGAKLFKICASGGVMSDSGSAGAQHYSDAELDAIVDEAHRRGLKVAAHTHGAEAVKTAVRVGIDCIEHGFLVDDEAIEMMVKAGTFLVPTTALADYMDTSKSAPSVRAKAEQMFPLARTSVKRAADAGVKIALGTDAPAIPHGKNALELVALVSRGLAPLHVLQAATINAAELIDADDRGRLAPGLLADVIGVPGNPLDDITVTQNVRFVMKGGKVFDR
jgi:imidazolonepropionase-like amidohydrolase